jgi:hypothetical protein
MGQWGRRRRVERVEAQGGEGENLKVDAGFIHGGNAAGTKVEEFGLDLSEPGRNWIVVGACGAEE